MPKVILAIGAHPDDIDFGCVGSLATFAKEGADIYYLVCTDGNRGSRHHAIDNDVLVEARHKEQQVAADVVGVKEIFFLNEEDGNLIANLEFKEKIVKIIRKIKPDMVFTHDPDWIYRLNSDDEYAFINHNDHRQTGIATLDAVYPLSRDLASFPDHSNEGLTPHTVHEVFVYWPKNPNYFIDISETIDKKVEAIKAHASQLDDPEETGQWMKNLAAEEGQKNGVKFAESFTRLLLK